MNFQWHFETIECQLYYRFFIYIKWFNYGMNRTHFQISLLLHLSSSLTCIRWQNNLSVFREHKPTEKNYKMPLMGSCEDRLHRKPHTFIKYIWCVMWSLSQMWPVFSSFCLWIVLKLPEIHPTRVLQSKMTVLRAEGHTASCVRPVLYIKYVGE